MFYLQWCHVLRDWKVIVKTSIKEIRRRQEMAEKIKKDANLVPLERPPPSVDASPENGGDLVTSDKNKPKVVPIDLKDQGMRNQFSLLLFAMLIAPIVLGLLLAAFSPNAKLVATMLGECLRTITPLVAATLGYILGRKEPPKANWHGCCTMHVFRICIVFIVIVSEKTKWNTFLS